MRLHHSPDASTFPMFKLKFLGTLQVFQKETVDFYVIKLNNFIINIFYYLPICGLYYKYL
jgi:hypothetical protein